MLKYYLIDGRHRLEAHNYNKEDHIHVNIKKDVTDFKTLFLQAVKANLGHGKPFDWNDKEKIAITLGDKFSLSNANISKLLLIPTQQVRRYTFKNPVKAGGFWGSGYEGGGSGGGGYISVQKEFRKFSIEYIGEEVYLKSKIFITSYFSIDNIEKCLNKDYEIKEVKEE